MGHPLAEVGWKAFLFNELMLGFDPEKAKLLLVGEVEPWSPEEFL
jgi:hypothetical protein